MTIIWLRFLANPVSTKMTATVINASMASWLIRHRVDDNDNYQGYLITSHATAWNFWLTTDTLVSFFLAETWCISPLSPFHTANKTLYLTVPFECLRLGLKTSVLSFGASCLGKARKEIYFLLHEFITATGRLIMLPDSYNHLSGPAPKECNFLSLISNSKDYFLNY